MIELPTRDRELEILRSGYSTLACIDEVGRGALAGPVLVGIVVVTRDMNEPPQGIKDSKLLSVSARQKLFPRISDWALGTSTGQASAAEIDEMGIMNALAVATQRGLSALVVSPDAILLDGNVNYLSHIDSPPVFTEIKGDMHCTGVAAASVIAKVTRDAIMHALDLEIPGYAWDRNKGYSSLQHIQALSVHGVTTEHRRSWNLPGVNIT
jgi:ribonuclease HII